ncbi:uncharacterized protein LOC142160380 [Mixophyes fleayi]|uniref:uncharacterized protein LOC142160380 n=1 Tax=Mixophyes fleayi TaxID=3061075 RepID=UPI003F4D965D
MTLSVQDNDQKQASLLCLVQGISNVGVTVWISNDNENNRGTSLGSRFNIISTAFVRPSSTHLFVLHYGNTITHILVPLSKKSPSPPLSNGSLETHHSSNPYSESLPTIILPASPYMHLNYHMSSASSKEVNTLIITSPFNVDLGTLIFPPIFNEDEDTPSKQNVLAQISHLVSAENLISFALLSLPNDQFSSSDSVACVPETESNNILDSPEVALSGEANQSFCNEDEFPEEPDLRMTHDLLLLLTIRIIVFKLLIFDLLMTGTAILQTCRIVTQNPKYTD